MALCSEVAIEADVAPRTAKIGCASEPPPYAAPARSALEALRARVIVFAVRWYAWAFREVWPLHVLWPAPSLGKLRLLVRYDHVVEALTRPDVFAVPFGPEMRRLNDGHRPGTPFLLGIDDPGEHARQAKCLMAQLGLDDIEAVARISFDAANERLAHRGAEFDAIHELITAVPIEVCKRYYGLPIASDQQARSFADASIELSGYLFGKPPRDPSNKKMLEGAGNHVRWFVDQAIDRAAAAPTAPSRCPAGQSPRTLAAKLRMRPKAEARATLMGMVVGFVPTNTLAGGYMLDVLLDNDEAMAAAVAAARAGDDDRLWACLFEALRLRPVNLGPFRECRKDYRFDGAFIPAGKYVWVMTGSAMCDSRKVPDAGRFDPSRSASSYLHFGFGMHWCIGAMLARAQLTQTFKALLLSGTLKRVTPLKCRGTFPDELTIRFEG